MGPDTGACSSDAVVAACIEELCSRTEFEMRRDPQHVASEPSLVASVQVIHAITRVRWQPPSDSSFWSILWRPCCSRLAQLGQVAATRDVVSLFASACKLEQWNSALQFASFVPAFGAASVHARKPVDLAVWLGTLSAMIGFLPK